jgi:glutaredoxin
MLTEMGSGPPESLGRGRRCLRHALAAGPDGLCALCRSESLPPGRVYSLWVVGGPLLALLLATGGVLAYRAIGRLARSAPVAVAEPSPKVAPPQAPAAPAGEAPPAEASEVPLPSDVPHTGDSIPLTEPIPSQAVADLPAASAVPATSAAAGVAAQGRPPPSEAQLRAALAATPIVMYSASWCSVCRKARAFLSANGFRVQEIDVDASPSGWSKVQQLIGRRAVPVIVIDGHVGAGFSPESVMDATARSMERRLGVTGIHFRTN